MSWPFQIAYEGDFRSLCTVTFGQKVDFLIVTRVSARDYTVHIINECLSYKFHQYSILNGHIKVKSVEY